MSYHKLVLLVALVGLCFQTTQVARGDLLLGLVTPVQWDVAASPDGIYDVMFAVRTDSQNNTPNELNAFSLALRILPAADAEGELVWESARLPPVNSTFPSFDGIPQFSRSGDVVTFSVSNGQFGNNGVPRNVTVTSTPTNLLAAKFSSRLVGGVPGPINGRFLVYAVAFQTTYFTEDFGEYKFANVPEGSDDPGVLLGEIRVIGIPEPSAGALCLLASYALGLEGYRKRCNKLF